MPLIDVGVAAVVWIVKVDVTAAAFGVTLAGLSVQVTVAGQLAISATAWLKAPPDGETVTTAAAEEPLVTGAGWVPPRQL